MADTLLLQFVSPERVLVEEQVTEMQIPALDDGISACCRATRRCFRN
jgi:hypothetical protein